MLVVDQLQCTVLRREIIWLLTHVFVISTTSALPVHGAHDLSCASVYTRTGPSTISKENDKRKYTAVLLSTVDAVRLYLISERDNTKPCFAHKGTHCTDS